MHLVVFDIDGTITDSIDVDDACFIKTYKDLYDIDLSQSDWNTFPHVTDWGLTREIFKQHFQRLPSDEELEEIKRHFLCLLEARKDQIGPVKGVQDLFRLLRAENDVVLALATGGWQETAQFKLNTIGLKHDDLVFSSSNDHYDRSEITAQAIEKALSMHNEQLFESTTYVGDGLWDLRTAENMGIEFIGVDAHSNNKLLNAGARHVLSNFTNIDGFMAFLKAGK